MQEIPLCIPRNWISFSNHYSNQEDVLEVFKEIKKLYDKKEKIFIRWDSGDREGSIGEIKKIFEFKIEKARRYNNIGQHYYLKFRASVGFKGKPNRATINLYKLSDSFTWLKDYEGPTVWKKLDKDEESKRKLDENPLSDMRGNKISVNDVVVFTTLTSRYGRRADKVLDYGIVRNLGYRYTYNHKKIRVYEPSVIVESVTRRDGGTPYTEEIFDQRALLIINDTELHDDALLAKLQT